MGDTLLCTTCSCIIHSHVSNLGVWIIQLAFNTTSCGDIEMVVVAVIGQDNESVPVVTAVMLGVVYSS